MATCRSCQAAIVWARNSATGRPMPLNLVPSAAGTIELTGNVCTVLTGDELADARARGIALHTSHFATCLQILRRVVQPERPIVETGPLWMERYRGTPPRRAQQP